MSECTACRNGTLRVQLVETWVHREGRWVLFKSVPALVCDSCGEKGFSQEVAERLARVLDPGRREVPTDFIYTPVFDLAVMDMAPAQGTRVMRSGTEAGTPELSVAHSIPLILAEASSAGVPFSVSP